MNGDKLLALLHENAQEFYVHRHDYTIAGDWVEQALEVLRAVEWMEGDDLPWDGVICPICREPRYSTDRSLTREPPYGKLDMHRADCKLAALIGAKVAE